MYLRKERSRGGAVFVGRVTELETLEELYTSDRFQMVVVYGRRRVGKTTLLDQFSHDKNPLYFTAQEESSVLNLRRFSEAAYARFGIPKAAGAFGSWVDALEFVADQAMRQGEPLLFVFDEFPYAATADPSLPSALQIAIDHGFKQSNCCLVLCGSNEGFMVGKVLGSKSPLFGRRTAQIRLKPFDYQDAMLMLPNTGPEEALRYYATFGGTPYYLEQVSHGLSYEQNVARLLFRKSGLLYSEPSMLLRQELREPALYNSVLSAVAHGATAPKVIAERAGVARESVNQYLKTLLNLGVVERSVPFGENPSSSRKSLYSIADPFFAFWYRFVGPSAEAVELGAGRAVATDVCNGQALSTYEGVQFERVCREWAARQNRDARLPFLATSFGRWWGPDPALREQVDIDLVVANATTRQIACGECKWRSTFDETQAIETLRHRAELIRGNWQERYLYLFTKRDVSAGTHKKIEGLRGLEVVTARDIFAL